MLIGNENKWPRGNANEWMMRINWSENNVSTCQWVNEIGI